MSGFDEEDDDLPKGGFNSVMTYEELKTEATRNAYAQAALEYYEELVKDGKQPQVEIWGALSGNQIRVRSPMDSWKVWKSGG